MEGNITEITKVYNMYIIWYLKYMYLKYVIYKNQIYQSIFLLYLNYRKRRSPNKPLCFNKALIPLGPKKEKERKKQKARISSRPGI